MVCPLPILWLSPLLLQICPLFHCNWPLASSCDEMVIVGGYTLCVVFSCKYTLDSTRLTHISLSCRVSASVLFSVCVAAVDLAVSVFWSTCSRVRSFYYCCFW